MTKTVAVIVALALAATSIIAGEPRASKPVMLKDADFRRMPEAAFGAWLAYTLARADWVSKNKPDSAGSSEPGSFDEELAGREMLVEVWSAEKKRNPRLRNTYLDLLIQVAATGYLREYVWTFLRTSKWKTEPEGLRLDEFETWRGTHLKNHRAVTVSGMSVIQPGN